MKRYQHPQPVLTEEDCKKAQRRATDAFGGRWPHPGHYPTPVGVREYNGGCVRDGQWYAGENFPEPKLPKGWKLTYIASWGYHIQPDPRQLKKEK